MQKSIYSKRSKILRELIVRARKRANLTQLEVAKRLNRPQSFIAKVEGGERRIDLIEFIELSDILGINPNRAIEEIKNS